MYLDKGDYGYGHYTLQSQGEGLTGYYLTTAHVEQVEPVRAELSVGQKLNWWSGCMNGISELRM